MLFKRVMALLALAFGFLGVVACLAGIYAAWLLGSRLKQTNERGFALLDRALASAQDRIRGVQQRIGDSKIRTGEIAQSLRDWSAREAKERLVSRLEIENRAEKLAGHLQAAELWLETSTESMRGVQQIMELGNLVGAHVDLASLEEVLEKLTLLGSTLQQTERMVDGIREFAAGNADNSQENRVARARSLLGRLVLTIGEMDTRLEEAVARFSELQANAKNLKARMSSYILLTTIGGYLLLAWIAAGQAALCLYGCKNGGRSRSSAN
jgi:hypothetical protein